MSYPSDYERSETADDRVARYAAAIADTDTPTSCDCSGCVEARARSVIQVADAELNALRSEIDAAAAEKREVMKALCDEITAAWD